MTDLAARLERLTPEQRRLFELRRARALPLGPEQEQAWRRALSMPETGYNYAIPLRLTGELDVPALEAALTGVVERHPALRAGIAVEAGRPFQRVGPPEPVALPVVGMDEAGLRPWLQEFMDRRFDLDGERLWRAGLLRLGPSEHVLAMAIDQLVCDSNSRVIVIYDLLELYGAAVEGRPARLAEMPLGYAEYVEHRRRWMLGREAAAKAAAWRADLAGARVQPLPSDRPRPSRRRFAGVRLPYVVPARVLRRLRGLNEREGVSMYMGLMAVFSALVSRYTGAPDVVMNTHVFNRLEPGSERLVGNFTSYVLPRMRWTGDPSFTELVRLARAVTLTAFERKDVPAAHVVEELGWGDAGEMSPVSQFHLVVHQAHDLDPPRASGLDVQYVELYLGRFGGELGLFAYETEDELEIMIEYSVALFDEGTILRVRDDLAAFLAAAVERPQAPVSTLLTATGAWA